MEQLEELEELNTFVGAVRKSDGDEIHQAEDKVEPTENTPKQKQKTEMSTLVCGRCWCRV